MPFYKYRALNKEGKSASGTLDATSLQEAKDILRSRGLMPIVVEISADSSVSTSFFSRFFERSVNSASRIRFTKQLSVLLRSGVPLLQSIELLADQFEGRLKRILLEIKERLQAGESFGNALASYPKVFSNIYVQLVRAGEASGKLEKILDRLNVYLEKSEETRKRLKKALTYPIALLSLSFIVVLGMILGLVPMFAGIFSQMNVTPPPLTQFLIDTSDFLKSQYLLIIIFILLIIGIFIYWKSTKSGRKKLDEINLKLPLVSYLVKTKVVVQFSSTLGMLLESGVNLAEALDIVCNIIDNTVLIDSLKKAREKIIKEGKITQYLQETNIFPSIAIYMIKTGEQSGELASMLNTVGKDYDVELNEMVDSLISKINPLMLVVIGGVVIMVVVALFLPMFDIMEKIS